jgi:hypothetical protein
MMLDILILRLLSLVMTVKIKRKKTIIVRVYMYKYRFAVFLHKISRLTKRICDVTQTVKNLVNRKRDCVFIYRQKERRSFHKTKELYEIFLNYTSSYKKYPHRYDTHCFNYAFTDLVFYTNE